MRTDRSYLQQPLLSDEQKRENPTGENKSYINSSASLLRCFPPSRPNAHTHTQPSPLQQLSEGTNGIIADYLVKKTPGLATSSNSVSSLQASSSDQKPTSNRQVTFSNFPPFHQIRELDIAFNPDPFKYSRKIMLNWLKCTSLVATDSYTCLFWCASTCPIMTLVTIGGLFADGISYITRPNQSPEEIYEEAFIPSPSPSSHPPAQRMD